MPDRYNVASLSGTITKTDAAQCLAILEQGKAVNIRTAARELPRAAAVVLAKDGDRIIGIGAIKGTRLDYAVDIASESGVPFSPDMPELGYVAVDDGHQGHGLSHCIVSELLPKSARSVFATTDNERMKRVLRKAGFERRGRPWKGKKGFLSLWIRNVDRLVLTSTLGLKGWLDYDRAQLPKLTPDQRVAYFEWRVRRVVIKFARTHSGDRNLADR